MQTTYLISGCYVLWSLLGAGVNETDQVPGQSWRGECLLRGFGHVSREQLVSRMGTGVIGGA